jgi:hypothetical protein
MPHLPPAHHETRKYDSPNETKIKEKQNETILDSNSNLAKSMIHHNQTKKLTTWFLTDKVDEDPKSRLKALEEMEKKVKIAKPYNKCVVEKSFQVGDLVWKTILPLGTRSGKFGKWSPSWEGPFRVIRVVPSNAYFVDDLEGHSLSNILACGKTDKKIIVLRRISGAKGMNG